MEKKHENELKQVIETKFEMISLKLQATKIRNSQKLQDGLDALMQFVDGRNRTACYNM